MNLTLGRLLRVHLKISTSGLTIKALPLLVLMASPVFAETPDTTNEAWPEIDVFVKLNDRSRLFLMYTATRQTNLRSYADGQTGIHFDFWALPALRRKLRAHNADASRGKALLVRNGYLYSQPKNDSGSATEHMWVSEATGRAHLPGELLLSDRNRFDLRWTNGSYSHRYRNRLKLERTIPVARFELTPYAHAEIFRDLDRNTWSRFRYAGGMEWTVNKHFVLEAYILRQNTWASVPQFVNAYGFAAQFYVP